MVFEHLVWCLSVQGLIRGSSMQVASSVDGVSPELCWNIWIDKDEDSELVD